MRIQSYLPALVLFLQTETFFINSLCESNVVSAELEKFVFQRGPGFSCLGFFWW